MFNVSIVGGIEWVKKGCVSNGELGACVGLVMASSPTVFPSQGAWLLRFSLPYLLGAPKTFLWNLLLCQDHATPAIVFMLFREWGSRGVEKIAFWHLELKGTRLVSVAKQLCT